MAIFLGELVAWLIAVLVLFGAARLLGGRAGYTTTLRAVGFAEATRALALFALIPDWGSVIRILVVVVTFFAVWIAAVEAQQLTRWRGLLLPIVSVTLYTVAVLVLSALAAGAAITFQSLAHGLGL